MTEIVKSKDLRTKILLIIGAMIVIRIGSIIPIPGVNADYMKSFFKRNYRKFSFQNVIICSKYFSLYHSFHYYSAAYGGVSGLGRDE